MRYFKNVRKAAKKGEYAKDPPLLVVHGGAGTGKSELIRIIAQWCESTLRSDDDRNPDQPFIILAAPTGTAASNIKGLTMHTAFSLPFGNKFVSLGDKKRDDVRTLLERLKLVVIDEMSMVKSDQLYQLNLRLQEIMGNSLDFGGVSILMFGDLLQLRPVMAHYIFEEPKNPNFLVSHQLRNLWQCFTKVELRYNHRQGNQREFADALGRIRYGQTDTNDMKLLESRVSSNISSEGIHLFGTNAEVNAFNDDRLEDIEGREWIIMADNIHPTRRNYQPKVGKDRSVNDTPFQSLLKVKIGARVMVTFNIEVKDRLVNGALGTVHNVESSRNGDCVNVIFVKFDDAEVGEITRLSQRRTHGLTPIKKMSFEYSIGSKTNDNVTHAKVIQFPIKLAFGATVHKFQGQTIKAPTILVGHMEKITQPSQAYVLFGRVQSAEQLYLTCFDQKRMITVNDAALQEARTFQRDAVNVKIIPWRDEATNKTNIAQLNVRSLRGHYQDVICDIELLSAHCICLTETWLEKDDLGHDLQIDGYSLVLCNAGRGKGVAMYTRLDSSSTPLTIVNETSFQILKLSFHEFDLFCCYRSSDGRPLEFVQSLRSIIDRYRKNIICGDFNLSVDDVNLAILPAQLHLRQIVDKPTHIEGNKLDHIYTNIDQADYHLHPAYYSDHDITYCQLLLRCQ